MAMRQSHGKMVRDRLEKVFKKLEKCYLPKSSLGKTVAYALNMWPKMRRYLEFGQVEIDNNLVENTIRPLALLRKNALFAGSEFGGEMMAVVSSLIATCKMNGVEPHAYFTWVFEKVAKKLPLAEYQTLLPWNCPTVRAPAVTSG